MNFPNKKGEKIPLFLTKLKDNKDYLTNTPTKITS
jgi:hypothetical protein